MHTCCKWEISHVAAFPVQQNQPPAPFYRYPLEAPPLRYPQPNANAYYLHQHMRGMLPPGFLIPHYHETILNDFLAHLPPVLHESFVQNFLQYVVNINTASAAEMNESLLPPFAPHKGPDGGCNK